MEKTFIIFKPDSMEKRVVGTVLSRLEGAGFEVVGCKMGRLSPAVLRQHYAHVADKPFYPEIEGFMSSRPVKAPSTRVTRFWTAEWGVLGKCCGITPCKGVFASTRTAFM